MSETTIIILEEVFHELKAEYRRRCLKISTATSSAYNIELRIRAVAELLERESEGSEFQHSQAKILENCGLNLVQADGEDKTVTMLEDTGEGDNG